MNENIWNEDRFFYNPKTERVEWMYYNPDAYSGSQFVKNTFDFKLLEEAMGDDGLDGADGAFDFIGAVCVQYCSDIGEYMYEVDKEQFESEPYVIGCTDETLVKLAYLFTAVEEISKYERKEFDECPWTVFEDLRHIPLGYTTDGTGEHEFEMRGDLVDSTIKYYIDGNLVETEECDFTDDAISNGWYGMSNSFFEHMVGKCEELLEKERVCENC